MSFASFITKTIFGRQIGLQAMSSNVTGSQRSGIAPDFLVGPEDLRRGVTTAESTGTNVAAWGISRLPGTSAASSAVYVLDPPIPGVRKTIMATTDNGPVLLRTQNLETIVTTAGSSFTTIKASSLGGAFELVGLTTAIWLGLGLTSGTSSQASGFGLTTST
jgi:hypothetical protein